MESCYLLLIFILILDKNLIGNEENDNQNYDYKKIEMEKLIKGLSTVILTLENSKLQLLNLMVDIIR